MSILLNGNVGIGTVAPLMKTEIQTAARNTVFAASNWETWADLRVINPQNTSGGTFPATGIGFMVDAGTTETNGMAGIAAVAGDGDYETGLVFVTRPSGAASQESLRILSGGGLTFLGDTATANALHDYEEGTFTPVLSRTSLDVSYATQAGKYTKVGNIVTVTVLIILDGVTASGSGNVLLTGLPYSQGSASAYASVLKVGYNDTFDANIQGGYINGATVVFIPVGPTQSNFAGVVSTGYLAITGTYIANT
jgi:hypothetical protein